MPSDSIHSPRLDVLTIVADDPRSGARVRDELEAEYERDVPKSNVYHYLQSLIDAGYVESDTEDGRTNVYTATDRGEVAAREYIAANMVRLSEVPESYR